MDIFFMFIMRSLGDVQLCSNLTEILYMRLTKQTVVLGNQSRMLSAPDMMTHLITVFITQRKVAMYGEL